MALFGKKKEKKAEAVKEASTHASIVRDLSHVLKHARITEKATMHVEQGVYTFDIDTSATKSDVSAAVRLFYKVTPRLVRVVRVPTKEKRNARTGKTGITGGGKKAYVYLKKGETLNM